MVGGWAGSHLDPPAAPPHQQQKEPGGGRGGRGEELDGFLQQGGSASRESEGGRGEGSVADFAAGELKQETGQGAYFASNLHFLKCKLSLQGVGRGRSSVVSGCEEEESLAPCEEIQVALVCAGAEASRTVITLIKSILFYRRNPVHLHFISDSEARNILGHLFDSWRIPQVKISLYRAEDVVPDVSWIPNKHYSGVYGLLKLTLPKILPSGLEKVIILDTDVIFATDIGRLWSLFTRFKSQQALGLVENQSDWYIPGKLWKNHRPWPALNRGFNTGVILMSLKRLRSIQWNNIWRTVAENDLVTQLSTSLADQDILNAVIKHQSELLFPLDCKWNVQLSDNSLSDSLCYDSKTSQVNVVHFNSPKKVESENKHISYFRNLYLTFLNYDGNLLRRELYNCHQEDGDSHGEGEGEGDSEGPCSELNGNRTRVYRTHLSFIPNCLGEGEENHKDSVTLSAQLSLDRLAMLELILSHWTGPVSLALYLSDSESQTFLEHHSSSEILRRRCNVGYHLVYKEGKHYPVNLLRNLAMEQATTEYLFLADVDFLPSLGSYEALQSSVSSLLSDHPNRLLVIPAFESSHYNPHQFPDTKAELVKKLDLGEIFTFRQREWPAGHRPTNYPHWRTATTPYSVAWLPDYEPYIVGPRSMVRYDTRFSGFGWNKVSHIMELHAMGKEFVVVPDVFMVHQPHTPSLDLLRFRSSRSYRECLLGLKAQFIRELETRTGKTFYNRNRTET